jgi:cobalamin synthase
MPNLTSAPRTALAKAKPSARSKTKPRARRGRPRRRSHGWLTAVKVAFLLERFRRRRSSPSLRQIALVVVGAGFVILAIRALSRRKGGDTGAEPGAQQSSGEVASTPPTPTDDGGLANESRLTDTVQSEMARHDDASTPTTGSG